MAELAPPNAKDVEKVVVERLKALDEENGVKETVTIEWRDAQVSIPVISMPVDLLAYNPDTHRVRAQRTLDSEKDAVIDTEPFGPAAQAYLHELLMGDPADPAKTDSDFEALKADLDEHGQNDPGIITRSGVLINGNTRRAALAELDQANIRVGVLPPDASIEDRQTVELSLQLRKDHRRDYSFMNSLLAIDERVQAGWSADKIQRDFRIRAKTFERSRWILDAVREVIERSTVEDAAGNKISMRLIDFETDQGKLEELHRRYTVLKPKSPDEADAMREQRLLAIALNKSKTDLRLIEADFSEQHMANLLPEAATAGAGKKKIPGTKIEVDGPSNEVGRLKALTTAVLQARTITQGSESLPKERLTEADASLKAVANALERGLDKEGRNARLKKRKLAPAERLSDVVDGLDAAVAAVAEARASGTFDPEDIDDAVLALRKSLIYLAQTATRGDQQTAGTEWLRLLGSLPDPGAG